jgi:hypothetical protein
LASPWAGRGKQLGLSTNPLPGESSAESLESPLTGRQSEYHNATVLSKFTWRYRAKSRPAKVITLAESAQLIIEQ